MCFFPRSFVLDVYIFRRAGAHQAGHTGGRPHPFFSLVLHLSFATLALIFVVRRILLSRSSIVKSKFVYSRDNRFPLRSMLLKYFASISRCFAGNTPPSPSKAARMKALDLVGGMSLVYTTAVIQIRETYPQPPLIFSSPCTVCSVGKPRSYLGPKLMRVGRRVHCTKLTTSSTV